MVFEGPAVAEGNEDMSLFGGLFAGLFLECPFEWFWTTFGCILDRFSISKPLKNEAKNEAVFGVGFLIQLFVGLCVV